VRKNCFFIVSRKCSDHLFFDEVATDLVVEVIDVFPLNALSKVLFLLSLEGELDEDLLQLFIYEVDAQLLESVFLWILFSLLVFNSFSCVLCPLLYAAVRDE